MKPNTYETVAAMDDPMRRAGTAGKELYRVPRTVILLILAIAAYGLVSVGFTIYILRCPSEGAAFRVLLTGGQPQLQTALMFDSRATNPNELRVPLLTDYNSMYGLVADSMNTVASAGYYGTATVPTRGSRPYPVYLLRTYILAVVVVILVLTPCLAALLICLTHFILRATLRRTTFLTIANAVRGPWWDATLWGTCLMSPSELRNAVRGTKVTFGNTVNVDSQDETETPNKHFGLAQHVVSVKHDQKYFGTKVKSL
ncbi:hypothetical protein EDD37DRAFT_16910 [Exophiala viscosa]|uniref:uncharacterized protein n=1 Tax=Exophiala viscosa TaxID=2486360 RepID=UPI00219DA75D|nr:hypothetical protein EDD37DRAFT_16910 [Exophiala viscosa]